MAAAGVDGLVELTAELDRLSKTTPLAQSAPRSSDLYRYLSEGMRSGRATDFRNLTTELIQNLGIWWSPEIYATLPTLVPWCIRDRSCRYDQGPESWGSPRSDGYLRDDNSIIKKLPLPLVINGGKATSYHGRKPWRGFTACHIWRDLPGGEVAGADPWLYSFAPNLIWLPKWLAPLTDQQGGEVQALLQRTSIALFEEASTRRAVADYAALAWRKLPAPAPGESLSLEHLHTFDAGPSFISRRLKYLEKFVKGCDEILSGRPLTQKIICTRYSEELPGLDHDDLQRFRNIMDDYRQACSQAQVDGQ